MCWSDYDLISHGEAEEMRKTIIGAVLLIAGVLQTIGIILCGVIYLPHQNEWLSTYPSKLWFLIMAGKSKFSTGADGLGLGILFIFGIIMLLIGFCMLISEYIKDWKLK